MSDGAGGGNELVHVDSGNKLAYLNEKSSNGRNIQTAVTSQNVAGVAATSEPGQLNSDSLADVVWRSGNQPNVRLGNVSEKNDGLPGMTENPLSGASMALYDVDDDGQLELVYVDGDQFLKYYDFESDSTAFVLNENGDKVDVAVGPGVA